MKKLLFIISIFSISINGIAINYYVSPSGNNANNGLSSGNAFKTITKAAGLVNPGDTVFIMDGIYNETVRLSRSGSSSANIVFKSVNKWGAKLQTNSGSDGFGIDGNYIEINGIELTNPGGHGINAENNHHIRILNCHLYNCGNSGFSGGYSDFYYIEGNVCHNNAKLSWYSGISIYEAKSIGDNSSGFHIIIRNNISYSNFQTGGPFTDGNGIIIDDWNYTQNPGTPYAFEALVENNLCYNNGGSGIKVVWSDRITVRNNTVYKNNTDNKDVGSYKGNFYVQSSRGCTFANNISWADPSINSNITAMMDKGNSSGTVTTPNKWEKNIFFNGIVGQNSMATGDGSSPVLVSNINGVNPLFIAPGITGTADFHLQATSPAIDMGIATYGLPVNDLDGNGRVQGSVVDLGCYEYDSTPAAPVINSSLSEVGNTCSPFTYTITAANNPTSYTTTPLPIGLSINTTTGVISGNPTTVGTTNVTIGAINATGTDTKTLVITITGPSQPVISSVLSASGGICSSFSYTITAIGCPTSYSATSLPAGLSINTTTGVISGNPITGGITNVTIGATNAIGTGTSTLVITIAITNSIWDQSDVPVNASDPDNVPVELGVKFKSDITGFITGIRFYKGTGNTGTHVGNLWSSTGNNLATVTFTGETATGWQQANFTTPVAITAGTVYIASYYAPVGRYVGDANGLTSGKDNVPLHAIANSVSPNGVYKYATGGGFPDQTYGATNYWVDVVFNCSLTTGTPQTIERTSEFNVYPNPFTEYFTLNISPEVSLKNAVIRIYDVCGNEIKVVSITGNETIIAKDELKHGIYFYSITNYNENIGKGKLILQ